MNCSTKDVTLHLFEVAQRTPFHIAPEKGGKLASEIFGNKKWRILPQDGCANFRAVPDEATLYLRHSGLASLWCVAYTAFHVSNQTSRLVREISFDSSVCLDIGEYYKKMELEKYISYARRLFHADNNWPDDLSKPETNPNVEGPSGRVNNAFFGALSWIMLHEIAHVYHKDEELVPSSVRISQEFKADNFATKWSLDEAGNGLQREFRVLMISIALVWLFLLESERGQGTTHPPTIKRFREVTSLFDMQKRSAALENSVYIFKAILDPETVPPAFNNSKESFDWISMRLETLFPVRR